MEKALLIFEQGEGSSHSGEGCSHSYAWRRLVSFLNMEKAPLTVKQGEDSSHR